MELKQRIKQHWAISQIKEQSKKPSNLRILLDLVQIVLFIYQFILIFLIFLCSEMESVRLYPTHFQHLNLTRFDTGGSTSLREGDWICLNCHNFNYSFRNLCNRCKQQTKSQNMELQNIIKSLETNLHSNQFAPQNYQTQEPCSSLQPKIWFNQLCQTPCFSSVLFLSITEPTVQKQFEYPCFKQKFSMCSTITADNSEDEITLPSESKQNSMELEREESEQEEGGSIDSYLLRILND